MLLRPHKLGIGHGWRFCALLYWSPFTRGAKRSLHLPGLHLHVQKAPCRAGQGEATKLRPIQCAIAIKSFLSAESGVTSPLHRPINAHILYLSRFCFASKLRQKWGDVKLFTGKMHKGLICIDFAFGQRESFFVWLGRKKNRMQSIFFS